MRISDWSSDVCSSDLLANIGQEAFAVDRTIEDARRGEPIAAQGAQEGHGAPVTVRGEAAHPLASRPPAAQWGHVGLDPGLVDEHETAGIETTLPGLPAPALAGHVRPGLDRKSTRLNSSH